jgi:hypothetical protein
MYNACQSVVNKNEPQLQKVCLKTYDVGPWPIFFYNGVSITLFKRSMFAEHVGMISSMYSMLLTIGYHANGTIYSPKCPISGHITRILNLYRLRLYRCTPRTLSIVNFRA